MKSLDVARLEIQTAPATWINLTAPTITITPVRRSGDVGGLTALVVGADLDPTVSNTLRFGRLVRILAKQGSGWKVIYTGTIETLDVDYHPLDKHQVSVNLTATDNVAYLANEPEHRGVATIYELRWLLAGRGIPFNINGSTAPIGTGTVVATNDNASLWDQILATRDSKLGYAWVDQENRLQVHDRAQMDDTPVATIGPDTYRDVVLDFNSDQIINSVTVEFQRYAPVSDTTTEITYGPYEDAASIANWGRYSATVTMQAADENETAIVALAQEILTRNATGELRVKSMTIPIDTEARLPLTYLDLNQVVNVASTDETTTWTLRIIGITHTITGDRWYLDLEFDTPGGITMPATGPSTGISIVPEGSVGTPQIQPGAVGTTQISFTHRDIGGITTTVSATSPTGAVEGDLWIDEDNQRTLHRWNGTTWVPVRDEGILDAIDLATNAQTSADGKNTVIRSTATASSPGNYKAGDLWFRYSGAGVIGMWLHSGSAWVAQTLRNEVIATLDAAKITTGTLEADRIAAGSITGTHLKADAIDGKHITGAVIDGGQINGTEINGVDVNGASITGGLIQTATSGERLAIDSANNRSRITFHDDGTQPLNRPQLPGYVEARTTGAGGPSPAQWLSIVGPGTGAFPETGIRPYISLAVTNPLVPGGAEHTSVDVRATALTIDADVEILGIAPGRALTGDGFDSGWWPLTLASGWTGTAHYRVIGGVVYLRGSITRTSGSNNTVATLPAAIRPAENLRATARNGSGVIPVGIRSDGLVNIGGYNTAEPVDLESIPSYPLD